MKRKRKILLTILPVMMFSLVLFLSFGSNVLGVHSGGGGNKNEYHPVPTESIVSYETNTGSPETTGQIVEVDNIVNRIWGTILSIFQILAFAAIVIATKDVTPTSEVLVIREIENV